MSSDETPQVTLGSIASGDTANFSQAYDTKDVGTGKTLTPSGSVNDGNSGNNYNVSFVENNDGVITAKELAVSFQADNKVYDGNTDATIKSSPAPNLIGVISGDNVTLNTSAASAGFNNKSVGTGKPVTGTGFSKSGADAGNYVFASPQGTTTANITPKEVSVSFQAENKVYNGNANATIKSSPAPSLSGVVSGDTVMLGTGSATASFADKNVGTGKTVTGSGFTKSGADAGNYVFASPQGTTTADITKRDLTVSATGMNKVYDGNANATVNLSTDKVSGDSVSAAYTAASFNNKNVGNAKPVSVTGISISGTDASNYNLTNTTAATTANITPKTVTGTFTAANKVFDTTTAATITGRSLSGVVSGDDVSLTGGTATFNSPAVGNGKTVTGVGFTLSGADTPNYSLASSTLTTTANITAWNALGYGFYQPVGVANSTFTPSGQTTPTTNPGDYWNTVKGGSTVPLKFNVFAGAVEKTSLADIASFQQGKLSNCSGGVGEDPIDITSTGNTSLRYDGTGAQWIQNWATPKVNGDTCYRAWVTFADGSTLEAFFKLKK